MEDVTVTITASGDEDILVGYETSSTIVSFTNPQTPVGCTVSVVLTEQDEYYSLGIELDGDDLTLEEIVESNGLGTNCKITATRD